MGKLNNEVAVDGDENELVWTELDQNFFVLFYRKKIIILSFSITNKQIFRCTFGIRQIEGI